ncbi:MAG: DoxX family protein [Sporomusaceae bacterium]|nr:DoxX family protein [Sporomusaceae bacterium]
MQNLVKWLDENRDEALFVVRLLIGFMFVFVHGGPKIMGGEAGWAKLGSMIGVLGFTFAPAFMGFIAAVFELLGGIFIFFGLFTRLGALMILATLLVAAPTMLVSKGLFAAAPAIEDSLLMILVLFSGGGKYSLDYRFFSNKN